MIILNIIAILGLLLLEARLILELRDKEPELYESLGRPHLWFPNVAAFNFGLDFIVFEHYKDQLVDPELRKQCAFLRIMTFVWVGLNATYLLYGLAVVLL